MAAILVKRLEVLEGEDDDVTAQGGALRWRYPVTGASGIAVVAVVINKRIENICGPLTKFTTCPFTKIIIFPNPKFRTKIFN